MQLNAIIRGQSLDELMANADVICKRFFGSDPYEIAINPWDTAGAEFDDSGTLTGFQFSMVARKVNA